VIAVVESTSPSQQWRRLASAFMWTGQQC